LGSQAERPVIGRITLSRYAAAHWKCARSIETALSNGNHFLTITYYACFRIGVIPAPLNISLKAADLDALLQRLQPALYIGQAALYGPVAAIDVSILAPHACFVVGTVDGS
jgi:acyl-CoA synthetase (AMP-forming)/AMP-acid ligase II